jgi:FdhD protein
MKASRAFPRTLFRAGARAEGAREVPEETPVALSYDGTTQAVMMATPADLEDFGLGFSLTEGIVAAPEGIERMEAIPHPKGIEIAIWLAPGEGSALAARRRRIAGSVGCGLCGIDSIEEALRPLPRVPDTALAMAPADVTRAMEALAAAQPLFAATRAVHAAGLWRPGAGLILAREDVGRHNALDKLAGAAARAGIAARDCALILTSRVSTEMVQKAAILGTPILIAASAPTAAAIRLADEAGITLAALVRADGFELFAHPARIGPGALSHVA